MSKLKPAVLGGLVVGVLSSIPYLNYCCIIWAIGGGLLAGALYIKASPTPVRPGDGAIVGALAGVIGSFLYLVIFIPVAFFVTDGGAELERELRRLGFELPMPATVMLVLGGLLVAIVLVILSVVGGLLAVPLIEKRKNGTPQAPPPLNNVGGGPGGYAA